LIERQIRSSDIINEHVKSCMRIWSDVCCYNIQPISAQPEGDIGEMANTDLCCALIPRCDEVYEAFYSSTCLQKNTSSSGIFAIFAFVFIPSAFSICIFCSMTATLFLDETTVSGFTDIEVAPQRIMNSR